MLSKCANPKCAASFRYLHEGRLFRVELESESRKFEYFWLCDECARIMTLGADGQVVPARRPLPPPLGPQGGPSGIKVA